MNDHIAKPIYVDEPLLISKKNCNYSVATVKVLNSYVLHNNHCSSRPILTGSIWKNQFLHF